MSQTEYFELKKDFWICRWLKKPSSKEILSSEVNIVQNNRLITIGISDGIVNKIMDGYKEKLRRSHGLYKVYASDLDDICSDLELPKPIVVLVLERKGIMREKPKIREANENE